MSESFDLLVRGGTVMTPAGARAVDVGVRGGRIVGLGRFAPERAGATLDVQGLHVLPGVIDSQVHFREPGLEHKEDLESGSRGAVLGGVTAVFEMPNTKPATDSEQALADKLERARGMWCDHAFFVGATGANAERLGELEMLSGCAGVKIFMGSSTGDLLVEDDPTLERVLRALRRPCSVHAEDEPRLRERQPLAKAASHPRAHPEWRDPVTALRATERIVRLAHQAGRRVHVLHITTKEEIQFLAEHKDVASVETTPQHLTLAAPDCYERLGTFAQMNPPVRDAEHQRGLWWGIDQGVVDVIGSDHAPHTREEKARPYPTSPSGMTGVQTLVPVLLDQVNRGRLTLERFVDLTSAGPARVFGIAGKGRIAVGFDADLTIVDLASRWTVEDDWIASKAGWTPFAGSELTGRPLHTVLRGRIVVRDGELQGEAGGRPVRFHATLEAN